MSISCWTARVSICWMSRRNDWLLKKTKTVLISDVSNGAWTCQPKNPLPSGSAPDRLGSPVQPATRLATPSIASASAKHPAQWDHLPRRRRTGSGACRGRPSLVTGMTLTLPVAASPRLEEESDSDWELAVRPVHFSLSGRYIIPPGIIPIPPIPIPPMPIPPIPIPPMGPALMKGSLPPGGMMILLGLDGLRGILASWASSVLALTAQGLLGHRWGILPR